jgi:N-acetylglucosaminyldiphosphoundecaprenol N-acetyl-beta-D-mannosaminyltransferase
VSAINATIDLPSVDVCGLPVHQLTLDGSVRAAESLIDDGGPHQHVVLNAAKVVLAHDDPALANVIGRCSLINADGQSIVWASWLLGHPLPERVAGIDFMYALWDLAARRGYRVYLLGAEAEVVSRVADAVSQRGVGLAGYHDGFWTAAEEPAVVAAIAAKKPDLLFVAIPSPRKEQFLSAHLEELGAAFVVGVGGAFDVVAGVTRRAPTWMQRAGLEWLFRLMQEPRRMAKRYVVGNTRFIALVLRSWLSGRSHRATFG